MLENKILDARKSIVGKKDMMHLVINDLTFFKKKSKIMENEFCNHYDSRDEHPLNDESILESIL